MRVLIVPIPLAILLAPFQATPTMAAAPAVVTLCQLASNPARWKGRIVRLTATYMSDRFERDLLVDERCKKVWFEPWDSKKGDHESLGAFNRAMIGDGRSVRTTDFSVDIVGRVSYRRKGRSSGRITILRVLSYREFERLQPPPEITKPSGG